MRSRFGSTSDLSIFLPALGRFQVGNTKEVGDGQRKMVIPGALAMRRADPETQGDCSDFSSLVFENTSQILEELARQTS